MASDPSSSAAPHASGARHVAIIMDGNGRWA
ncbi:MAG: isoprenyl transferase, partial [Sphingopyxis sp.]